MTCSARLGRFFVLVLILLVRRLDFFLRLRGFDGRNVSFVDAAAVNEKGLAGDGVGHSGLVDVVVTDVRNLQVTGRRNGGVGVSQT